MKIYKSEIKINKREDHTSTQDFYLCPGEKLPNVGTTIDFFFRVKSVQDPVSQPVPLSHHPEIYWNSRRKVLHSSW